jgi:hypothetical protein
MAKKNAQAVPSTGHSAERRVLKLLHRLGGLFSEMGYWYDQKTNRYIPWDTEVMRCIPSIGMNRDDNAAMVEYVASLGFSGDALSLARAIQRVYAFDDDRRLWPARSDKEGWKKMQPWVDMLRYRASLVAAQCATIHRLIKNTIPKTPPAAKSEQDKDSNSELSGDKGANRNGQVDKEVDKKKLSTRGLTPAARQCAKTYKVKRKAGEKISMKAVILDYIDNNPTAKKSSIRRSLTAHPEAWKVDNKVDKAVS